MSVIVIGDINVDMEICLPQGPRVVAHGNPDPRLLGGGSAANTAAALGRLGLDSRFVGTVGEDSFGRFAQENLREAGVDVDLVDTTSDDPTVVVITVVPPDGDRLIYVWPSSGGAHQEIRSGVAVGAVEGADWLHVSGICLRVAPARDAMLEAMAYARSIDVPVSLDLNLRLENWGWGGDFRRVIEQAIDLADIVMGAAADEIMPLSGSEDPLTAAQDIAGSERIVVERLGEEGAVGCDADGIVSVPSFEIDVVDTVGAGDAHNAGFIYAQLLGLDLEASLRWGNAVAALTVSHQGARGTPSLADVESLLGTSS